MRNSKYADFRFTYVVHDAVRKSAKRQPSRDTAPWGAKLRMLTKQFYRPLELRDERVAELGIGFARIEQSAFDELLFRL